MADNAREAFLQAIRIPRDTVLEPKQFPIGEPEDSQIPQLGFIGSKYSDGGVLLLAINPGGGGDSYRRPSYDAHLPLLARCQNGQAGIEELGEVFSAIQDQMPSWRFWGIIKPTLDACRKDLDEVAFLNWCPFRTRMDKMPSAFAMRRSFDCMLAPMVSALNPSLIIALGMKVGYWVHRYDWQGRETFIIPRSIGDGYLKLEAKEVLQRISERA